jgi:hypothetical protein
VSQICLSLVSLPLDDVLQGWKEALEVFQGLALLEYPVLFHHRQTIHISTKHKIGPKDVRCRIFQQS